MQFHSFIILGLKSANNGLEADHFVWISTMIWAPYCSENNGKPLNMQLPRNSHMANIGWWWFQCPVTRAYNYVSDFVFLKQCPDKTHLHQTLKSQGQNLIMVSHCFDKETLYVMLCPVLDDNTFHMWFLWFHYVVVNKYVSLVVFLLDFSKLTFMYYKKVYLCVVIQSRQHDLNVFFWVCICTLETDQFSMSCWLDS